MKFYARLAADDEPTARDTRLQNLGVFNNHHEVSGDSANIIWDHLSKI